MNFSIPEGVLNDPVGVDERRIRVVDLDPATALQMAAKWLELKPDWRLVVMTADWEGTVFQILMAVVRRDTGHP